jgi:hypothetical protein
MADLTQEPEHEPEPELEHEPELVPELVSEMEPENELEHEPEGPAVELKNLAFVEPSGQMLEDTRWRGFHRSTNKVFFLRYAARCSFCLATFEARPSRLAHHFMAPRDSGYACKKADDGKEASGRILYCYS